MKAKSLIIIILVVAGLAFWVGRQSAKPKKKDMQINVTVPEFGISRIFKELDDVFPLVITKDGTTQEYDASTPIGELPPQEKKYRDSVPFFVEDSLGWIRFLLSINILGDVLGYRIDTEPQFYLVPFEKIEPPGSTIWRGALFAAAYHDLTFDLIGVIFYKRVGLIGKLGTTRIWLDEPRVETKITIGVAARIL